LIGDLLEDLLREFGRALSNKLFEFDELHNVSNSYGSPCVSQQSIIRVELLHELELFLTHTYDNDAQR